MVAPPSHKALSHHGARRSQCTRQNRCELPPFARFPTRTSSAPSRPTMSIFSALVVLALAITISGVPLPRVEPAALGAPGTTLDTVERPLSVLCLPRIRCPANYACISNMCISVAEPVPIALEATPVPMMGMGFAASPEPSPMVMVSPVPGPVLFQGLFPEPSPGLFASPVPLDVFPSPVPNVFVTPAPFSDQPPPAAPVRGSAAAPITMGTASLPRLPGAAIGTECAACTTRDDCVSGNCHSNRCVRSGALFRGSIYNCFGRIV